VTGDYLINEGHRLARPCVYLRTEGADYAAIWGGPGVVPAREGPFFHWLTIDRRYLPGGFTPGPGCLSVYTNEEDFQTGLVPEDLAMSLPSSSEGTKLYAHPGLSLPPVDAIFRFGSPEVGRWLRENDWEPDWEYNENFRDQGPIDEYHEEYRKQSPLYRDDAYAVLGGWHLPWPEGDWVELIKSQLIAWTFKDSEPWVEVWRTDGLYRVIQRIT
jgi:hypothetical protein